MVRAMGTCLKGPEGEQEGYNSPGAESLGGAEESQQFQKYFLQYSGLHLLRKTLGSNMGAPNLFVIPYLAASDGFSRLGHGLE